MLHLGFHKILPCLKNFHSTFDEISVGHMGGMVFDQFYFCFCWSDPSGRSAKIAYEISDFLSCRELAEFPTSTSQLIRFDQSIMKSVLPLGFDRSQLFTSLPPTAYHLSLDAFLIHPQLLSALLMLSDGYSPESVMEVMPAFQQLFLQLVQGFNCTQQAGEGTFSEFRRGDQSSRSESLASALMVEIDEFTRNSTRHKDVAGQAVSEGCVSLTMQSTKSVLSSLEEKSADDDVEDEAGVELDDLTFAGVERLDCAVFF